MKHALSADVGPLPPPESVPYVRVYPERQTGEQRFWRTLERMSSVAAAITAAGVIWAIWRKAK